MSPDDVDLMGESMNAMNTSTEARKYFGIKWNAVKINYMFMSYQQNVHTKLANTVHNLKMWES